MRAGLSCDLLDHVDKIEILPVYITNNSDPQHKSISNQECVKSITKALKQPQNDPEWEAQNNKSQKDIEKNCALDMSEVLLPGGTATLCSDFSCFRISKTSSAMR